MLLTLECINENADDLRGSGIYRIFSPSGKGYVGSAGSARGLARRLKDHLNMLQAGTHHAFKLQLAWNKYGALSFEVLELVQDGIIEREQHYIDFFRSAVEGYNSNPTAGKTRLGSKLSDETKEKIRQSNTGKKASEETKARMRATANMKMIEDPLFGKKRSVKLIGVPRSEEFKMKNSASQKLRFEDPEERKRAGRKKGYTHTPETVAKMCGAKSEEHRKNLSLAKLSLGPKKQIDETKLRELFESGMAVSEIAIFFGVSASTLWTRRKRLGLLRKQV